VSGREDEEDAAAAEAARASVAAGEPLVPWSAVRGDDNPGLTGDEMAAHLLQAMYRRGCEAERALVHVPYAVSRVGGTWRARAWVGAGHFVSGSGPTMRSAVDSLRDALVALLRESGPPEVITIRLQDLEGRGAGEQENRE
jgi:hypothetical protein